MFTLRLLKTCCILLGSIIFFVAGCDQLKQSFYSFNKLIRHDGIVENMSFSTDSTNKEHFRKVLNISLLNNDTTFITSTCADGVATSIQPGDSITLYTKDVPGGFGNTICYQSGSDSWTTKNPNEIFHLVNNRNKEIIIDYDLIKDNLRSGVWIWPFAGLCFLGWALFTITGAKSPFFIERTVIS
jgi:hypothetical protein